MERLSKNGQGRLATLCLVFLLLLQFGCSSDKVLSGYNALIRPSAINRVIDVAYGEDARQKMDIYQPVARNTSGSSSGRHTPRTIFFVYGGTWKSGEKEYYEFIAANLVRKGHSVIIPDYRLYPEVTYPGFVEDIANAIAHYERNFRVNTSREIVLMGHSAGAYTAALLATRPDYFRNAGVESRLIGLIGLAGPYDLPLDDPDVTRVFVDIDDPVSVNPVALVSRLKSSESSEVENDDSESNIFSTLLLHAPKDERVFFYHSERFAQALSEAELPVRLVGVSGGHVKVLLGMAAPLGFINKTREEILAFLDSLPVVNE